MIIGTDDPLRDDLLRLLEEHLADMFASYDLDPHSAFFTRPLP